MQRRGNSRNVQHSTEECKLLSQKVAMGMIEIIQFNPELFDVLYTMELLNLLYKRPTFFMIMSRGNLSLSKYSLIALMDATIK